MRNFSQLFYITMNIKNSITVLLILLVCRAVFPDRIFAQNLKISDNHRFLVKQDGTPFFWQGDTAWELFIKLNQEETEYYLRNRAGKGFNVIQCVLTGTGMSDLDKQAKNGYTVFVDMDPAKPNEKYFDHVDRVIDKAGEFGLYLAILPAWGSLVVGENPFLDDKLAYSYGRYLGARYKNRKNIVWILGGDATPEGYEHVWAKLAEGIKAGGSNQIMSYHIYGEMSSSEFWHTAGWLDFNMIQSGHTSAFYDNYRLISIDYEKKPVKPVIDGEPIYERIPIGFCPMNGRADAHMVRVEAYWSVFAGAFGFTYGCNGVWQFYNNEKGWAYWADLSWKEAIEAPGSYQMRYVKDLMLSRPFLSRIPDQSVIEPGASHGVDHLQATRDGSAGKNDATYIMVYFPYLTHKYKIRTDVIPASKLRIWWYDPRTGAAFLQGEMENTGTLELPWGSEINTNGSGPDWVLVIDDASKKYLRPGISV